MSIQFLCILSLNSLNIFPNFNVKKYHNFEVQHNKMYERKCKLMHRIRVNARRKQNMLIPILKIFTIFCTVKFVHVFILIYAIYCPWGYMLSILSVSSSIEQTSRSSITALTWQCFSYLRLRLKYWQAMDNENQDGRDQLI